MKMFGLAALAVLGILSSGCVYSHRASNYGNGRDRYEHNGYGPRADYHGQRGDYRRGDRHRENHDRPNGDDRDARR